MDEIIAGNQVTHAMNTYAISQCVMLYTTPYIHISVHAHTHTHIYIYKYHIQYIYTLHMYDTFHRNRHGRPVKGPKFETI